MTHKKRGAIKKIISSFILMVASIGMLFPFYWMMKTALMTNKAALEFPPKLFTWPLYWGNFQEVFQTTGLGRAILNSFFIASVSTVGVLFFSSLAAYAFAKLRFRHSKTLFGAIFATMLIPSQILLIPMYVLFSKIGWVDSYLPLIIPQVLINGYGVFLIRQFMVSVPDSYIEAARIDGLSNFGIYWRIMLPLCKPSLVTLGVFTFVGNWNNFIGPLIYIDSEELFTLPLIINTFRTEYSIQWGLLMAASAVSVIPMIIIYLFAQKSFVEGIATTGIKG